MGGGGSGGASAAVATAAAAAAAHHARTTSPSHLPSLLPFAGAVLRGREDIAASQPDGGGGGGGGVGKREVDVEEVAVGGSGRRSPRPYEQFHALQVSWLVGWLDGCGAIRVVGLVSFVQAG